MAIVSAVILKDRGVVMVSGADAPGFLQGLISNDIKLIKPGAAIHAGLLSPQGKILFEFIIAHSDDGYLIDCAAEHIAALVKRLSLYKLRAQVEIANVSHSHQVAALWPEQSAGEQGDFADPRLAEMGQRIIAGNKTIENLLNGRGADTKPLADYHARRISLGIAEMGQDYATGEVYPHEANFDQLDGVSYSKGCYVGQEVVSRMKHKTSIRKRFVPIALSGGQVEAGTEILADGKAAGQMGSNIAGRGLALLRLDRIDGAAKISAGEASVTPQKPGWADFDIPGAE